jgi:hypothetical protein
MMFLNHLEGMSVGAVEPLIITEDTPIDHGQWQDGKPWHIPTGGNMGTWGDGETSAVNHYQITIWCDSRLNEPDLAMALEQGELWDKANNVQYQIGPANAG